jgi:hypothetical protein
VGVALAPAPPLGHDHLLAVRGQIGDENLPVVRLLEDLGAHGHLDDPVHSGPAVAEPAGSGPPALGLLDGGVAVVVEGQQIAHGAKHDVAALASVAAVGPPAGNVLFPAKRHAALAAAPGTNDDLGLVNESHVISRPGCTPDSKKSRPRAPS